jgi:hypothetical protein
MARHKSKYNWSLLDRKDLIKFMSLIYPEVTDQKISIPKFHRFLTSYLKSRLPIIVTKKTDKTVERGLVYVGGTYYRDNDKSRRKCIEIIFFYNPEDRTLFLSKWKFFKFCKSTADTLLHEIMHMRQYRRRKFKILPDYTSTAEKTQQRREQEYLGNTDEIDAYSFNIACDLMDKFYGDTKLAANYLTENHYVRKQNSWQMYLSAFDYNHNHPIIKRLKKKIIGYFPNAKLGKPYRSKDWINY